ncbi:MAG: alpha/beta fold hydrolase [Bacteroidetes bacterium]|jgi:pimeloyl-ACP methyl ester carboxylesterase|nr:alpha/beta fold hydrolase [Bacteroidota bacterium]
MELFYNRYGTAGPPLIILHGLLGASGNWHTLSKNVFSKGYQVYTVDQRNHGESPHDDRLDYPTMADDLAAFMDQQGLDQAHILGHSMGGKTAMRFALDRPERVDRLIVVDIAPKAYPPHHLELIDALQALDLAAHDRRRSIDRALAKDVPSRPIRQFALKNLTYVSAEERYAWKNNLPAIRANYTHISGAVALDGQFTEPTLFVRGEYSAYVQSEDIAAIWQGFPNAKIVTVEDAAHWVHAEAPEAFAQVVMDFLRTQDTGAEVV